MTIDEMIEQRVLEAVPVDEATAAAWLADAGRYLEAAAVLLDSEGDKRAIKRLDRMRRDRNQAKYGSRSFARTEVEAAVEAATSVVTILRAASRG